MLKVTQIGLEPYGVLYYHYHAKSKVPHLEVCCDMLACYTPASKLRGCDCAMLHSHQYRLDLESYSKTIINRLQSAYTIRDTLRPQLSHTCDDGPMWGEVEGSDNVFVPHYRVCVHRVSACVVRGAVLCSSAKHAKKRRSHSSRPGGRAGPRSPAMSSRALVGRARHGGASGGPD